MRIGADGCAVQKRMNRYKAHDQIIRFSLAQLSREPVWGRSRLIRGEQIYYLYVYHARIQGGAHRARAPPFRWKEYF